MSWLRYPASLQPYEHHHVILTGLKTLTRYYYKVGDAEGGFSSVYSFVTGANAKVDSFSIVRRLRRMPCWDSTASPL